MILIFIKVYLNSLSCLTYIFIYLSFTFVLLVWIEPESFQSDIVYPNGLTTGFPFDYQQKIVNSIKGLKRAKLAKPGYSIEYDYIDPTQLFPTLETKLLNNLYLAGQINGTTGYEEAAAQGVLAGINAAGKVQEKPNFLLSRTESFIGVLVDDLTKNGVQEPYRMMTARSEYRLSLRPDNADMRLTGKGFDYGCVSNERYQKYLKTIEQIKSIEDYLKNLQHSNEEWKELFVSNSIDVHFDPQFLKKKNTGLQLLEKYNSIKLNHILQLHPNEEFTKLNQRLLERVDIQAHYKMHTIRQNWSIEQFKKEENLELDKDLNYADRSLGLNKESIEILTENRPLNVSRDSFKILKSI